LTFNKLNGVISHKIEPFFWREWLMKNTKNRLYGKNQRDAKTEKDVAVSSPVVFNLGYAKTT
jgi:hypothetical protein